VHEAIESSSTDSEEDDWKPPRKQAKKIVKGTLSEDIVEKIMSSADARVWAGKVNREPFLFNRASDVLRSLSQKMAERQRMILLADNSEYGWVTARKYQGDDWAISSRDQSKIAQAEAKAQRELTPVTASHSRRSHSLSPESRGRERSPYRKPT
jgi:hypothetical protein